ncbi:MAG: hypothetical protein KGH75_09845, partial [Rhodospirillales bacterium]|nr:hypothetical protein [Rhodospirillales bacterium]
RSQVAEHGNMKHLDKLVNDPNVDVRSEVAIKGHPQHLDKLVSDLDEWVRNFARKLKELKDAK